VRNVTALRYVNKAFVQTNYKMTVWRLCWHACKVKIYCSSI